MESTTGIDTSETKVIQLSEFKKKPKKKKLFLYVDEHYEHISLPLAIRVLAISTVNPFTGKIIYLCVDYTGAIVAFEEGDEPLWNPISDKQFEVFVNDAKEKAQGTKLEEEIQKS